MKVSFSSHRGPLSIELASMHDLLSLIMSMTGIQMVGKDHVHQLASNQFCVGTQGLYA